MPQEMVQYKVPQNVQREDQVLWFITLRQLIILLIGFGISYAIFVNANKQAKSAGEELEPGTQLLIWLPGIIAAAFAFIKIHAIPLFQFILLFIENTFFRSSHRYWFAGSGDPFLSMTQKISLQEKKKEEEIKKEVDENKIKHLAEFLDGQKSDFHKKTEK